MAGLSLSNQLHPFPSLISGDGPQGMGRQGPQAFGESHVSRAGLAQASLFFPIEGNPSSEGHLRLCLAINSVS